MEEYLDINKKKLDRADFVRRKALRFHAVKKQKTKKKFDQTEIEEEMEVDEIEIDYE